MCLAMSTTVGDEAHVFAIDAESGITGRLLIYTMMMGKITDFQYIWSNVIPFSSTVR